MGYRLDDTGTPASYDSTQRKLWFNRGRDLIFRERPWIIVSSNLTGVNGVAYSFELSGLTRFYRLREVSIPSSGGAQIYRDPRGMAAFREIQMGGGPLSGIPNRFYVENSKIYFNCIPSSGTVITLDYWQIPANLALDVDVILGIAGTGWDDLFLAMATLVAARDIKGGRREFGKILEAENMDFIYGLLRSDGRRMHGELDRFSDFVIGELEKDAESLQLPYSELGVIDGASRTDVVVAGSSPEILMDDYW